MRLLVLFVSVWALVSAKPEMYREKEDFEYSRSSSDEGSKSGYYGAQRGNMGGNYERAHNMDLPAQHQMSTLVRQVDGELGTGSNTRTGSVFTSGNSRGIYGSGNYDLSNLKGRNFEEGGAYSGQSHSSMSSGSASNFGYGHEHASSNSRYSSSQSQRQSSSSRFHSGGQSSSGIVMDGQQAENLIGGATMYDNMAAGNHYKYNEQNSNLGHSDFEENVYNSNTQGKYISGTPVKVYIRPSGKITIPVAAQTYDASHYNSLHEQNSINSDAEVLGSNGVGTYYNPITKHYESSYKYKKEWEKHDTQTTATPTENPFDLYDSAHLSQSSNNEDRFTSSLDGSHHNSAQLNNMNSVYSKGFSSGSQSSSSHHSRYQSGLNAESQNLESASAAIGSTAEDMNSRPKHYQSSYSYHKAWERQGDPYVIEPVGGSGLQTSQKLTTGSQNYGHSSSHQHGFHSQSHQSYSSGANVDCDEHGHIRVARSYDTYQRPSRYNDNFEQRSQNEWENSVNGKINIDLSQDQFTNLGRQSLDQRDNLENSGQQISNWDHLESFSQQQQNKWENQEELERNSHNSWEQTQLNNNYRDGYQNQWQRLNVNQKKNNNINEQNMENGQVDSYIHPHDKHLHLQNENISGQNYERRDPQAGLLTSSTKYNSWDSYNDNNKQYKPFSDYRNTDHSNENLQNRLNFNLDHQTSPSNEKKKDISNMWVKLDKLDKTLNTRNNNAHYNNIDSFRSTEKVIITNVDIATHSEDEDDKNIDEPIQPTDIERGDVGPEDTKNESNSSEEDNNNNFLLDSNDNTMSTKPEYNNFNRKKTIHSILYGSLQPPLAKSNIEQNLENFDQHYNNTNGFGSRKKVFFENVDNTTPSITTTILNQPMDYEPGDDGPKDSNNYELVSANQDNVNNFSLDSNNNKISAKPEDYGPGDDGPKDSNNYELVSAIQDNVNNFSLDSNNNKISAKPEYNNFNKNNRTLNNTVDGSLQPLAALAESIIEQNLENFDQHYNNINSFGSTENGNKNITTNLLAESNIKQNLENFDQYVTSQQSQDFKHQNKDQQLRVFLQKPKNQQSEILKQNNAQELKKFSHLNDDQQVENLSIDQQLEDQQSMEGQVEDLSQQNAQQELVDFSRQNTQQGLVNFSRQITQQEAVDFSRQNTQQELVDFSRQNTQQEPVDFSRQNTQQELVDFSRKNTQQEPVDFSRQNTQQQLVDFSQQNTDQQWENLSQKNTDHPLATFKQKTMMQDLQGVAHKNIEQPLEDFSQQNIDQQWEDFKQKNRDHQVPDFSLKFMDQQLEYSGLPPAGEQLQVENLNKNNIKEIEDQQKTYQQAFHASHKNTELQSEAFEQESSDLEMEDQNFEQQLENHNTKRKLDFSQHNNNTDQQLENTDHPQIAYKTKFRELEEETFDVTTRKRNLRIVHENPCSDMVMKTCLEKTTTEEPSYWSRIGNEISKVTDSVSSKLIDFFSGK